MLWNIVVILTIIVGFGGTLVALGTDPRRRPMEWAEAGRYVICLLSNMPAPSPPADATLRTYARKLEADLDALKRITPSHAVAPV
jgi:hypothetical protein